VQHLADRLTALEERMSENEFRAKQAERVQAQSAAAIAAQQGTPEGIKRSLAPLKNLKMEMIEAMNQMFARQKLEIMCEKRPSLPQLAAQVRITGTGQIAPSPIKHERIGEQRHIPSSNVIRRGPETLVNRAPGAYPTWMESTRLHLKESCLAPRYGCMLPLSAEGTLDDGEYPCCKENSSFL